ncbi:hypothetical protein EDC96DRAFT_562727 [Choanephora cucurbitarum]|nr:hypothetical protein EDC96DRAFT_562727 [Choanephora cucurbitarum]
MFADFYDAVPVAITDEDGNEIDVIMSPSHIEQFQTMLAKPTKLTIGRPVQDSSPESAFRTCDTVDSIGELGAMSQYLKKRHYIELNKDMIEIKPRQRFVVARALIGSVVIDTENNRGLLILALEVYGRDPSIDNHAEQRSSTGSTRQSTSVPSFGHNDLEICTMYQTEGKNVSMKLILGAHPFNASARIDNLVDQPECGPNTVNFVVPPHSHSKYKLYLDSQSWSDSLALGEKTNLDSIYTHSRLMQLRQLKTRFHEIDTYSSSRSTLFHGYLQQPMTVFTYGKGATSINSGSLSSRLLATLATSVMRDGESARLAKKSVEKLLSEFTKETKAKVVFLRIIQLFDDNDDIAIIGNSGLNSLAEELATLLAPYISTANKKSVVPSLADHLKSY